MVCQIVIKFVVIKPHVKSVSGYLLIASTRPEGQDGFSGRFAYVQTFVIPHTLNS
jgi:hypothetical protein